MYVKIKAKGHEFMAALYEIMRDGMLANDTPAYVARAEVSRDGAALGSCRWDGEGFVDVPDLLPSCDASQDVLSALERATRAELAKIGAAAWRLVNGSSATPAERQKCESSRSRSSPDPIGRRRSMMIRRCVTLPRIYSRRWTTSTRT